MLHLVPFHHECVRELASREGGGREREKRWERGRERILERKRERERERAQ